MKFCPVVLEICRGQVHGARKERRRIRIILIIIIIIRNGAKTISLPTFFGRLNNAHHSMLSILYIAKISNSLVKSLDIIFINVFGF